MTAFARRRSHDSVRTLYREGLDPRSKGVFTIAILCDTTFSRLAIYFLPSITLPFPENQLAYFSPKPTVTRRERNNKPAVVYFPAGTCLISSLIIDYYQTQLIGNSNNLPIFKATPFFPGYGLIDGDQYQVGSVLGFGGTNIFWRQIRNFVIDMTAITASSSATGIHWPNAQATSLQNIVFRMFSVARTQHQGIFIESGSEGFMTDLMFYGGF